MYLKISNLINEGNIALLNKANSNDPGLNHVEENERKRLKNSSGFKPNRRVIIRSTVKQKRPYPNEIEIDWLKFREFFVMKKIIFGSKFTYKYLTDNIASNFEEFHTPLKKYFGVLPYIASKVLCGDEYTKAADVCTFEIIACELITGFTPYYDVPHDRELARQICNELRKFHFMLQNSLQE
ncbi:hypothetical protein Glove_557g49 [Diversispora epigaea]|uniref:Protein kinase domain-containing protein n=1 Tax=Diversispora epigaea TaxID=1348612 RepID=A0A397GFG2_9GLOM|nr:hypothetical protein Glove_557g49 [Diversispora epigaea]